MSDLVESADEDSDSQKEVGVVAEGGNDDPLEHSTTEASTQQF